MYSIHDFGFFLASCVILNLPPGTDTFYILGRSISHGRSAGVASVLGISSGAMVHTFAAAIGLSAVLAASATAFWAVKLLGASYLVYLGVRMLLAHPSASALPTDFSSSNFFAAYRQGLLTNVLNPKVVLFFLAFVPQFISATSSKFLAFITLGMCFVITSTLWCLCLVWFSSFLRSRLHGGSGFANVLNCTAGILFIFLGIRLAASK
ncbi:MAG TPA: LysE family translocator [Burkholderiaceae bacterium]|nr:LysE family translocator [Burkholderiaceae bacterium]